MSVLKSVFFMFLLGVLLTGRAETVRFRSGVLLAAELSTKAPTVKIDPLLFPNLPENKVYAMIVLQLDPGRKISIYDYSVKAFGRVFPCVAICKNGRFVFDDGDCADSKIGLLFVLDGSQIGLNKEERLILRSCCPPEKLSEQGVYFRVLGKNALTDVNKVPGKGNMVVK